jgi:hypothetical protein
MCASGGQAGGTPAHLSGVGFLGGACVPSLVLGFRTPNLPLLPVREKGGGGMRGQTRTGMQRRSRFSRRRLRSFALVWGFRTPELPLLPVREEGGRGDEGTNAHGNAAHHTSRPRTLPLSGDARASRRCGNVRHGRAGGRDARAPGSRVPGSRFSVLGSLSSQFSRSQFSVLSSQFSVLGSQFSVLIYTCVASTASAGARAYVRSTPAHCRYRLPRI